MVTRHPNATKPRYTYNYQPDYTPLQKIAIFAAVVFAMVMIAITAEFVGDFIHQYHHELNQALAVSLVFIGVMILILIASGVFYVVAMLTLRYRIKRQTLASMAANNRLYVETSKAIKRGNVYLSEQRNEHGIIRYKPLPKHAKQQPKIERIESVALPIAEATFSSEPKNTLLSDIEPMQRLLIVGGQNSGKTTLLKHIAHQRSAAGNVLILDSHNHAGKWSDDYRIVGHGRDYQAIETELRNLVSVMDSRYKEYASGRIGERGHDLITVISDEFTTIAENINGLDSYLLPLLTESRKVGIDFIVACHSETAGSLGLKGRFDLKKNFDAVLRLKNYSGKRLIHLDNGEDIIEYAHCGEFKERYSIKPSQSFTNKLDLILNK